MDDLISKQSAIDAITDENIIRNMDSVMDSEIYRAKRSIHRIIASMPSAQPERKKGRWFPDVAYYDEDGCPCIVSRCSECGEAYPESNFCPNCGADMRGEE